MKELLKITGLTIAAITLMVISGKTNSELVEEVTKLINHEK